MGLGLGDLGEAPVLACDLVGYVCVTLASEPIVYGSMMVLAPRVVIGAGEGVCWRSTGVEGSMLWDIGVLGFLLFEAEGFGVLSS